MNLAAGILNSLGGLLILAGAWVQATQEWDVHKAVQEGRRPPIIEVSKGKFLSFWSFAGWYGWRLIFVGGSLVFVGSVLATIAAIGGSS